MKITELPEYRRIVQRFLTGEFKMGTKSELPIYSYEPGMSGELTPGHYVSGIAYGRIRLEDVPIECRTRDFFLNALCSVHKDVVAYVKEHLGKDFFDRDFFKDHIVSENYAIDFEENCFEYMPVEYIDEEMVSLAMLQAAKQKMFIDRRHGSHAWFYSVYKRKPEILTQDFWTLGARLFAERIDKKNKFLEITPEQYRTKEYYFAMCLENHSSVMEDFPDSVLTDNFLSAVLSDNAENIRSFSEKALEREVDVILNGESTKLKFWQAAILISGYVVSDIPLNDERVEFFLERYDESSGEYRYGFKDKYERFLREKQVG